MHGLSFFSRLTSFFILLTLSFNVFAWNALGHMVVASIAYQNLKPESRKKIDELVGYFRKEYSDMESFIKLAYWPDAIRSQKIEMFTHWHYIDIPFSKDESPLKNTIDTDNAVWALGKVINVVKNNRANAYERARFLAFLAHMVGDLHQPLHTVTLISAAFPDGDKGGNKYYVRLNNDRLRLHQLWDSGVTSFYSSSTIENANYISKNIQALYPQKYFSEQIKDLNPDHWLVEGMSNAKNYVYSAPQESVLTPDYVEKGKRIAQEEIALAGYRLAVMLNQLLK